MNRTQCSFVFVAALLATGGCMTGIENPEAMDDEEKAWFDGKQMVTVTLYTEMNLGPSESGIGQRGWGVQRCLMVQALEWNADEGRATEVAVRFSDDRGQAMFDLPEGRDYRFRVYSHSNLREGNRVRFYVGEADPTRDTQTEHSHHLTAVHSVDLYLSQLDYPEDYFHTCPVFEYPLEFRRCGSTVRPNSSELTDGFLETWTAQFVLNPSYSDWRFTETTIGDVAMPVCTSDGRCTISVQLVPEQTDHATPEYKINFTRFEYADDDARTTISEVDVGVAEGGDEIWTTRTSYGPHRMGTLVIDDPIEGDCDAE